MHSLLKNLEKVMKNFFAALILLISVFASFDFDTYQHNSWNPSIYKFGLLPAITIPLSKQETCQAQSITGTIHSSKNCETGVVLISKFKDLSISITLVLITLTGVAVYFSKFENHQRIK